MLGVFLYGYHPGTTSRHQFDADASRAGEEVEGRNSLLEVEVVGAQYVEQAFLREVRCGTCLESARYFKVSSLVYSADYSHNNKACMSKGILAGSPVFSGWLNAVEG